MIKFTKTDRRLELEGTKVDYDDGNGGVLGLLIARSDNNPHYEATLQRKILPFKKKMDKGKSLDSAIAKRIMNEVLAKEILLGWDDSVLLDDDGKPFKYSEDNALELLTGDGDLRDFVIDFSGDQSNFLIQKK